MKIAFFDTKPYDKPSFQKYGEEQNIKFKFYETKLNEDTVDLAQGYDAVCVFVNDTVNARVIDRLNELGVKVLALRCAGFNNVDMKHAFGKNHVLRVPPIHPMPLLSTQWHCYLPQFAEFTRLISGPAILTLAWRDLQASTCTEKPLEL